ncbi:MAG: helix-turn-helix domain-containing protein [Anaerolineales bacterium]|nr:helix-turn-helix domain-containing protein [Anaerolineales bacterium]
MAAPFTFGMWLKRRRQGLGLTQKELAHQVGYAVVTLRKLEADELRPSGRLAKKLARALELAPEEQAQFVRFARNEATWDDSTLLDRMSPLPIPATHLPEHTTLFPDEALTQPALDAVDRTRPKHNLPALTTALFGRDGELATLKQLLADPGTRLVTILSAGGMGKTSLAIAAAWQQVERFAAGVCWVPLAPLTEAKDLVLAIATALGLQLQGERTPEQQVGDFLRARHQLLVLDNFEHLLERAPLIQELLVRAPNLWVLVTSRRRLKLSSETMIVLDGLRFPAGHSAAALDYPAVQMFLLHARRVRLDYEPDEQELTGIAAVCRLVHGMPLGVLLAAAWMRALSAPQIAAEIARDQGFLQADMADVPARQRSLRAVFLQTWHRLSPIERDAFIRLSVFRGGATVDAARHVAGATVAVIAALLDNALLRRLPDSRYEIHELLRQFAQEQLEQDWQVAMAVGDAHSAYFSGFLAEREGAITCAGQRQAIQEVTTELDNIRVAWTWAVERRDCSLFSRAAPALIQFYDCQGRYQEGVKLCELAIERLGAADAGREQQTTLAILLAGVGWLYIHLGKYSQAYAVFTRSRSIYREWGTAPPSGYAGEPVLGLALLADVQGNYADAVALSHQALAASAAKGDTYGQVVAYYVLASTAYAQGEYSTARRHAGQAYALSVAIDSRWMMAYTAIIQGNVARACGEDHEAQQHYADSYAIQRELGNPEGMAIAQLNLAGLAAGHQSYQEAKRLFQDGYELYSAINDPGGQVRALIGLGEVAQAQGDWAQAGSYFCTGLELAIAIHSLPLLLQQLTPHWRTAGVLRRARLSHCCMDARCTTCGRRTGNASARQSEPPPYGEVRQIRAYDSG